MKKSFSQYCQSLAGKAQLLEEYKANPDLFNLALEEAIEAKASIAWRALWFINHILSPPVEESLQEFYPQLIKRLEEDNASLQRETLKLMRNLQANEEWETYLFDQAQKIWEKVGTIPSTRIQALDCMIQIAEKYPDLKNEIAIYQEEYYLKDLSPGIKRQAQVRIASQLKTNISSRDKPNVKS